MFDDMKPADRCNAIRARVMRTHPSVVQSDVMSKMSRSKFGVTGTRVKFATDCQGSLNAIENTVRAAGGSIQHVDGGIIANF